MENAEYQYASELIYDLKQLGDFCIGGACYPEGHTESANKEEDIQHLKEKVEAGCEFLTTQMFFDNNILYNFLYRIRREGNYSSSYRRNYACNERKTDETNL